MDEDRNQLISNDIHTLPWGIRKRLEFIEFRLFWEEKINRRDLEKVFNISTPQASADFSKYQDIAPGNMLYDHRGRFYYASPDFKPLISTPSAQQYLLRYLAVELRIYTPQESYLGVIPPIGTVPIPWRRVEITLLKIIMLSINKSQCIEVEYQPLSRTEKTVRWISPHALGYDGFRWHCRAYCHLRNAFRDFNLGRILKINEQVKNSNVNPIEDMNWNTFVTVKIGPNPSYNEAQRNIIEHEYEMKNGQTSIEVRIAMLIYLLTNLGFNSDTGKSFLPKQQIVLLNWEELKEVIKK